MAIILVMQILSYVNITKLQTSLRDFAEENLAQQMQINSLASDIAKLSSHEQTYLLTGDDKYLTLFEDTQEIINIKKLTSHWTFNRKRVFIWITKDTPRNLLFLSP